MSLDLKPRWSAEVISKAEQLVAEGKVHRDPDQDMVFWVDGSRQYRVQTDGRSWVSCTCKHGLNAPPPIRCSHSAAALMILAEEEKQESVVVEFEARTGKPWQEEE